MTTSWKPLAEDLPEGKKNLANAVRWEVTRSGKTLRQVAHEAYVSPAALSLIASGRRKPSDSTLESILRATASREERRALPPEASYITSVWQVLLIGAAVIIPMLVALLLICLSPEPVEQQGDYNQGCQSSSCLDPWPPHGPPMPLP